MKRIKNLKDKGVLIYFGTFSIFANLAMLNTKYILGFDMAFTPDMVTNQPFSLFEFVDFVIFILSSIFTGWFVQKTIFLSIFFIGGIGGFYLFKNIFKKNILAVVLATFYLLNPFVFSRYLAGQWEFLVGYILTPIFVLLLINLFVTAKDNFQQLIKILPLWIGVGFFSKDHFVIWGIVFLIFTIWQFINELRIWKDITEISKDNSFNIMINVLWIFAALSYSGQLKYSEGIISKFSQNSFSESILLEGFWIDDITNHSLYDVVPISQTFVAFIIFLGLTGMIWGITEKLMPFLVSNKSEIKNIFIDPEKKLDFSLITPFTVILVTSIILGNSNQFFLKDMYQFLSNEVALFRGIQEPYKFLSLYVLSISFFIGFFVESVIRHIKLDKVTNNLKYILYGLPAIIIFIISGTFIFGSFKEVKSYNYPEIYSEVNEFINEYNSNNDEPATLLILPWETQSVYNWTDGNIIKSPATNFFNTNVIAKNYTSVQEDNSESECDLSFVYKAGFTDGQAYELCLNKDDEQVIVYNTHDRLEIDFIFVEKVTDYEEFNIYEEPYFEVVFEDRNAILYRPIEL